MIIELLSRASVFNIPTIIDGPAHNMFEVIVFFERSQERNWVVLWYKIIVYFVGLWYDVHINFVQNVNEK